MKNYIFILSASALLSVGTASAQSATAYGGGASGKSIASGGVDADATDTLYIGAGTHNIDGTWEIYSSYVLIDPAAVITGAGTIVFYNPSLGFGSSTGTRIDANNISSAIDVNIQLQNDQGMGLTNLSFPADFIAAGWTEASGSTTMYAGRDLDLAVDGADITLGTGVVGDLRLSGTGSVSNYRPSRMVITNNSILSHMVKENFSSAFIFPVGIADGDYTPAQITNASSNTVSVSVQDYVASASPEALTDGPVNLADGMNRTWNIYANTSGISSTLNLQHNSSTNQNGFSDATHFVTQWGTSIPNTTGDYSFAFGTSPWQGNVQAAGATGTLSSTGAVAGSSMRSRAYTGGLATSASANQAYFTKSADIIHPLPISITNFQAVSNDCDITISWQSGVEDKATGFTLQHSSDGSSYTDLVQPSPKGSNSQYSYVHQMAGNGNHLYRLKMTSNEGTVYSPVVRTNTNCRLTQSIVKVYPSPTNGIINVEGINVEASQSGTSTIYILSLEGKVLQQMSTESSKATIDISTLPPAPYILRVDHGGSVQLSTAIIKQ